MKDKKDIYVLSIAGYDPCGGAGVLADVSTFGSFGVYGLAASTAITYQNENEFFRADWLETEQILSQIDNLASCYFFEYVKIGLVKDLDTLETIINHLYQVNPEIKIIWDPILKASAGFSFHENIPLQRLSTILKNIYLLTPNIPEALSLTGNLENAAAELSLHCNLIIKGGHGTGPGASDLLIPKFSSGRKTITYESARLTGYEKHGSGCVFSSAITASLAIGFSLEASVSRAKQYINKYLQSSKTKLGKHSKNSTDSKQISKLHYITDDHAEYSHASLARQACKGGADWIQLRVKNRNQEEWLAIALEVKNVCDHYGARLIINDNVLLAKEIAASGVHLGREDMRPTEARNILGKDFIIGGTANTSRDIDRLQQEGVDYIGLGPLRFTSTKKNLSPVLGAAGIRDIILNTSEPYIPVICIGGIGLEDIETLHATGCYGIAVSSAISLSEDPSSASFSFVQAVHKTFGSDGLPETQTKQQNPAITEQVNDTLPHEQT